jgi:hypothetical protein
MKHIFAAVFALAYVVGYSPAIAADSRGVKHRSGGIVREAEPPPRVPNMQSRIPAPLPAPAQPPVINGPLQQSPSGLPPMGGAR